MNNKTAPNQYSQNGLIKESTKSSLILNLAICFGLGLVLSAFESPASTSCESVYSLRGVRSMLANSENLEKPKIRVAAVQFAMSENKTAQQFLDKVDRYIEEATSQESKSDLIVFPELITTEIVNWYHPNKTEIEQLTEIAESFTPSYIDWLSKKSAEKNISILGGTTPRIVNGQIRNTAVLAMPDGQVLLQDKAYLTPDEKAWNWTRGDEIQVFNTPWGKTCILICFDAEFPAISQMLSKTQLDLILVPSWTSTMSGQNRVDWTAKARAIEHYAFVVKTGTVADADSTLPHFSESSIITPQEPMWPTKPVTAGQNQSEIIYSDLDIEALRQHRSRSGYAPAKEQEQLTEPTIKIN